MITTVVFISVLSILIIVHEFGHFIIARKLGVRVERFSLGFGPKLFSRKTKETEYTLSAIPLGGFVKLAGDSLEEHKGNPDEYFSQSPGRRFSIIFFGPLLNYVLGIFCFWLIFSTGYPRLTTKVGGLVGGFGAEKAGIITGDVIKTIDGEKVTYWEDIQKIIQKKKSAPGITVVLSRNNQEYTLKVPLQEKSVDDVLGKKHSVGIMGIVYSEETVTVRHNIVEAFSLGINKAWDLTTLTYEALWRMITGKISMRETVTGPLGMYYITSKVTSMGLVAIIHFMATVSISLGIFNLLPVPALDGGHIVLLFVEKIRGKYLSFKVERIISQVGFTMLISLALVVTYNDILRLFGEKIFKFFK